MPNSSREQQVIERLLNAKVTARSQRNSGSAGHAKMAVQRVLEAAADRYRGSPSVLEGVIAGGMQPKQAGSAPPDAQSATPAESLQPLDAVKVALAVRRRDEFCHGPSRLSWLRRRATISKIGMTLPPASTNPGAATANFAPPLMQPTTPPAPPSAPQPPVAAPGPGPVPMGSMAGPAAGDPAAAYAQLMSMIQPKPPVPMAGQGGTGLPTSTPGGEMGGRNTPTTNPIGLLSGLGVDPGGKSVMGNAAFGTKNSGSKTAGQLPKAGEYGAAMASGAAAQPQPQQPAVSATTGRSRAAINRQLAATPKPAPQRGSVTQPVSMAVGVPA